MIQLMQENDAPKEQYERMNLTEKKPGPPGEIHPAAFELSAN